MPSPQVGLLNQVPPTTISPAGGAGDPAFVQFLKQSGFFQPEESKKDALRKAIAQGLLKFGQAMSSNTGDFLPALAQSIGVGGQAFVDRQQSDDDARRTRARDLLKEYIADDSRTKKLDVQAATLDARKEMADQRDAIASTRNDLTRQQQEWQRAHGDRMDTNTEKKTEAYIAQGDTRLDQSETQQEWQRKHGDETLASTAEQRAEQARHNKATEQNANQLLTIAREKASLDVSNRVEQLRISGLNAKSIRERLLYERRTVLANQFKMLGLDKRDQMSDQEAATALKEYESYKQGLLDEISAQTGEEPNDLKSGGPDPVMTKPSAVTTAPAKPASKAEFDALPSGALYINPADGKTYRKK